MPGRPAFLRVLSPAMGVVLLAATTGLVAASDRSVAFVTTINPPHATSFDISWVENSTGKYFFADRSNNAIELINAKTDAFVGPIGHGVFTGVVSPCAGGGNVCNGPDGVLTDSAGLVWVGDGNSTIKVLNPTPNTGAAALIKSIPTCPTSEADCGTGGKFRADELSFDPVDHLILIANDAEGFLTFVHVDDVNPANSSVVGHFFYADNTLGATPSVAGHATAGGGIEQSVWVPQTGLFYQAVPANSPATTGFIDVLDPHTMKLVASFPVPGCVNGPTGLALGPNQRFLGACDNAAASVDVRNGQLHKLVGDETTTGGADEIWFNPGDKNFYLGISGPPARVAAVDGENDHVVAVLTGTDCGHLAAQGCGGHSVAAYSGNNQIFAPNRFGLGVDVLASGRK
jgi:hypothetical protein